MMKNTLGKSGNLDPGAGPLSCYDTLDKSF